MNRIDQLFKNKPGNILSVYYTAGFPQLNDTLVILEELEKNGADMVEIGMPFSDPLADGPVLQDSNQKALENGMSVQILFNQLKDFRQQIKIPVILMGYLNPVLRYGIENFCRDASKTGIDGIILPDLPLEIYCEEYKPIFEEWGLYMIFLITPETSEERIRKTDREGKGFIYMVSTSSTTGERRNIENTQLNYFKRIRDMNLTLPALVGFGISSRETFNSACEHARGAIVGSAFVRTIASGDLRTNIKEFVKSIK